MIASIRRSLSEPPAPAIGVPRPACARKLEGYVCEAFGADQDRFRVRIVLAYQGPWPKDGAGNDLDAVEVLNPARPFKCAAGRYVFAADFGAVCLANFDPEAKMYRAAWVER
jgi:hypothetical protein